MKLRGEGGAEGGTAEEDDARSETSLRDSNAILEMAKEWEEETSPSAHGRDRGICELRAALCNRLGVPRTVATRRMNEPRACIVYVPAPLHRLIFYLFIFQ